MIRFARLLCLVLLTAFVPLSPPASAADPRSGRFVDDDGIPGERYVERLADLGAIQGCDPPQNNRSCPTDYLTRAEAFKILIVAGQAYGAIPGYPDTLVDRFFDDDEMWGGMVSRFANYLTDLAIIHGCNPPDNDRVCPGDTLTRAQIAKLVVGTFHLTAPTHYQTPWTDTAGRWYGEAARIAAYNRLFDTSNGRFRGGDPVTRAQFAEVVVEAGGDSYCDSDPFTASRVTELESRYPGQTVTAYVYDTRTGCAYWMNPDERLRTASVFKVMVMAGTLLEAQHDGRELTAWELGQLEPMITESANPPVRALWRSFGASPWFERQTEIFGMDETNSVGDTQSVWGRTTTSAKDQADLIRQVLLGHWGPLTESYRQQAWNLMTSVVSSQTWGVTEGVPPGWTVAQKNGFAGHIANSVGFVEAPGSSEGYVLAVLTNWWSDWSKGVPVVNEIGGWVSSELTR